MRGRFRVRCFSMRREVLSRVGLCMAVMLVAAAHLGLQPSAANAQSPSPESGPPGLTMTAEPLLGGSFRPGTWMAVSARLQNDGPHIVGELRLVSGTSNTSAFSRAVDLPTGSIQEHVIYGQVSPISSRYRLELLVSGSTIHTVPFTLDTRTTSGVRTYVVAERPEQLVGGLDQALGVARRTTPMVFSIGPSDLPSRAQAWTSIDLLVWQDADSQLLDAQRLEALRAWLANGGDLLIVGGSSGVTTLGGLPPDLLPFAPERVIDVPATDLEPFGDVPATAAPIPAVAGPLARGTAIASSGDEVIAARASFGRGTVTILGFDPATPWLAESDLAAVVWAEVLPSSLEASSGSAGGDDGFIVSALGNMPAVRLPQLFHLFVLMVAYVVAIGPVNYVILRRRDRRELAWVTIPITIGIFALGAYLFGAALRGPNVVVNELAIVQGAAGADRGSGRVYVGVFSPGRATYDVQVGNNALVTAPVYSDGFGGPDSQTLDVLQGETSTIRRFGVSFGSLRSFVAEVTVPTPSFDAELSIEGDSLTGTVTNSSTETLGAVSVVFGRSVQHFGDLAAGETRSVELSGRAVAGFDTLSSRLVPVVASDDPEAGRIQAARRAIVDHLEGGWGMFERFGDVGFGGRGGVFSEFGPLVVAFRSGAPLPVGVGSTDPPEHIGETLYLLHARASLAGPVSLTGSLLQRTIVDTDVAEIFEEEPGTFYMSRGSATLEYRPGGLDGRFEPTELTVRFGPRGATPGTAADELLPLPVEEQPDPDAPLAVNPDLDELTASYPRLQLYDLVAQTWVEFEPIAGAQTYSIADPSRWIDASGTLRVRLVARGQFERTFGFEPRISGSVE